MQKVYLGVLAGVVPAKVLAAARGLLDFIYYAQYQSHTTKTLQHMQEALDLFHANKDAFVDLDIREHFNIPKLHSMLHYIISIQNLGSVDGLNSEGPERLHIDYAKKGYRASNKNDYLAQMAKWLQRQEAIDLRTMYLRWCAELLPYDETDEDVPDNGDNDNEDSAEADNHDQVTIEITNVTEPYCVAKAPAFPNTPLLRLEQAYGASEFLPALKTFIQENLTSHVILPNEYDRYNIYNNIRVILPSNLMLVIANARKQFTRHPGIAMASEAAITCSL